MAYMTVGWQMWCETDETGCGAWDERASDSWQNADQGLSMAKAAQRHADETGHDVRLERIQHRVVEPQRKLEMRK